jgi:glycine oxidase
MSVTVYDPDPGGGASWVAAGMLAPVSEAYFGEEELTALQVESLRRWPDFAAEVAAAGGHDVGYRTEGTLTVALTDDDLRVADRLRGHQERLGLPTERLTGSALRLREQRLSPRVRGGSFQPDDHQVDPRRLVRALSAAATEAGVQRVATGVTDVSTVDAAVVVVAAGCGSATLGGLPAPLPVRPVKGELLRLRTDAPPKYTIRGYADGRSVYLVPRADGEVIVGATVEERRDRIVTAGAVLDLLRAATDLVPDLAEYELAETCVGFRPGTPDNAPLLGDLGTVDGRRIVAATGHHRNGILLTPVTADSIADLVESGTAPDVIAPFSPFRFGRPTPDDRGGPWTSR